MRTQRITATSFMSSFSSPARSSVDDLDDLDDLGDFLSAPTLGPTTRHAAAFAVEAGDFAQVHALMGVTTDHPRDADGRVIPMTLQEQSDATGIPIEELN